MTALFVRLFSALLFASAFFAVGALEVAAGTTGGLNGSVTTSDGRPIAAARVIVASPSQITSTKTDERGAFSFLSLSPDTYVVSVESNGFSSGIIRNVTIIADQTRSVTAVLLRVIGHVSPNLSDLVRPGTTVDVYSVGPAASKAAEAFGGGADLQNAYSAIATVPGVFLDHGENGPEQDVYIRGGTPGEVGFEYDGVPINRAFDSAPASTLSNLGQQELQVYTAGGDAGSSASGSSGFINQVIRTGTYPGFADANLGFGSTSFYHGLTVQAGGASPDRNFSYYAGLGGYNQSYRYFDQFNGADQLAVIPNITPYFFTSDLINGRGVFPSCTGNPAVTDPFGGNPPAPGVAAPVGCYSAIYPAFGLLADIAERDAVFNVHIGLPHRGGAGKDDIQILYSSSTQLADAYSSPNDVGQSLALSLLGRPIVYPDALTWPAGTRFGQSAEGLSAVPYFDPSSTPHAFRAPLPVAHRDDQNYDDAIFKLQYQKNIASDAYVRLFVYSLYSNLDVNGPTAFGSFGGFGTNFSNYDYELDTHTRGAELKSAIALGSKHTLTGTLNYVTASSYRFNNQGYDIGPGTPGTNLTNGTNCYAYEAGTVSGVSYNAGDAAPCNSSLTSGTYADPTRSNATAVGAAAAAGATWRVTDSGQEGLVNNVTPAFASASLDDHFQPNLRLVIDAGVRFDSYDYRLSDTSGNGANFWFAAARNEFCYNPVTGAPVLGAIVPPPLNFIESSEPFVGSNCPVDSSSGKPIQTVHPDGKDGHLLFSNVYDPNEYHSLVEPRVGFTYSLDADSVLRGSVGRYSQGPNSGNVQYDAKQSNVAALLYQNFWQYGYTTPRHESLPIYSDDVDLSYEHRFARSDTSLKVTPYYRSSPNQPHPVSLLSLGAIFNSALQHADGLEVEVTKGDFKRDGLSFSLGYTYTHSVERFANYPGTDQSPLDPANTAITQYDGLTKAGGGAPCYANSGDSTPDPACGPTSIRNPYYLNAPQPLLSRNVWRPTSLGTVHPHNFTAVVSERRDRFTITPSFSLDAGVVYGGPRDVVGLDPRTCTNNSAGITSSPIATTNPLQADYTSCGLTPTGGSLYIPDPATGTFTTPGVFREPWQFIANLGLGYDVSPHTRVSLTFANVLTRCFGGSRTPWSAAFPPSSIVCYYESNPLYVSNFYNGTSPNDRGANGVALNPYFAQPYVPYSTTIPMNVYLQISAKL